MAPSLLFDISQIDMAKVQMDGPAIEQVNPHRGIMRQLDAVVCVDLTTLQAVAYKDVSQDEFWVPGHIPGRPLLPGVLIIEAAAQLASIMTLQYFGDLNFLGFVACDAVKFRGQVCPGDRLILLGQGRQIKRRRSICDVQGLVKNNLVFEATITGMPI